jgi:putative ABC transport system permease protein
MDEVAGFQVVHDFQPRSLILAYLLGVVLTLVVVAFSSWYVSQLNIVRAIRNLPEPKRADGGSRWALTGVLLLTLTGLLILLLGVVIEQAGYYYLGGGLLIIGLSMVARRCGMPDRGAYTLAGAILLLFFLVPFSWHPTYDQMSYGLETFVLSGVLLVTGAVLVVMYNSDFLLKAIMFLFGGLPRVAPVLRTAVANPLARRFRTGVTVAMFAMVVFTLVYISAINASQQDVYQNTDRVTGGFDIRSTVIVPVVDSQGQDNVTGVLEESYAANSKSVDPDEFETIVALSGASMEMRQAGLSPEQPWEEYLVMGVDADYASSLPYSFDMMAEEYSSPDEVWAELADRSDVALVSTGMVPSRRNIDQAEATSPLLGGSVFYLQDEVLPEVYVEARGGHRLRIIGVVDVLATGYIGQVVMSQEALDTAWGEHVDPAAYMFRVRPEVQDVETLAKDLERQFLWYGMDAVVMEEEISDFRALQNMVFDIFEAFLALGLIIGVAALGVIAARTVVERRQQIGVLRAVGFQRRMVQLAFLLESSFIALLGIALGVVLGVALINKVIPYIGIEGLECVIPWPRIAGIVALAYVAALVTAFLPARQAAHVQPAEALRYE